MKANQIVLRPRSNSSRNSSISLRKSYKLVCSKIRPPVSLTHNTLPTIGSISESTTSIFMKAEKMNAKVVKITLKSNWGHPSKLSLGSVVFFGSNYRHIPIMYCSTIPSFEEYPSLSLIFNENLIKGETTECWAIPWDSTNPGVSIVAIIPKEEDIQFIRIWNSTHEEESCTKSIEIKDSAGRVYSGDIPLGFGIDVTLMEEIETPNSQSILTELFPSLTNNTNLTDNYGSVPILSTNCIKLEILSNYSKDPNVGLNAIRLFDIENKPIEWSDIEKFALRNATGNDNEKNLFVDEEKAVRDNKKRMFLLKTDWIELPSIEIYFKEPRKIAKIEIWNLNAMDFNLKHGIKRLKVFQNNKLAWVGNLKRGNGQKQQIEDTITTIFFSDLPVFRKAKAETTE